MIERIYKLIDDGSGTKASKFLNIAIVFLILLNIAAVVVESYNNLNETVLYALEWFEIVSVSIFTIEYILRLIIAPRVLRTKYSRVKYAFSFYALIDLIAILPFYIPFIIKADLRILRMLRLTKVMRIMKLNRYTSSMDVLIHVFKSEKEKLQVTIGLASLIIFVSASLMYYIEGSVQPEAFSSIPASLWWAIATLTTVGYGDVFI